MNTPRSRSASCLAIGLAIAAINQVATAAAPQILDLQKPQAAPAAQVESVAINHLSFQQALRLTSTTRGRENKWSASARWVNKEPVAAGDVLLIVFHMRCVSSQAADGKVMATIAFGTAEPPHRNCYVTVAKSDQEWKKHQFAFKAKVDYAPGQAKLAFGCGGEVQTLELGGVEVYNYGTTKRVSDFETSATYPGIEDDAPWRQLCLARIERIRKSPLEVRVVDSNGKAIAGAEVRVTMKRHGFRFGSSFNPHIYRLEKESPKQVEEYHQRFAQYFNCATPEAVMNWRGWEASTSRTNLIRALDWLDVNRIPVVGHPMVWQHPKVLPERANEMIRRKDYAAYTQAWNEHLTEKLQAISGRMCQHFVTNEFVDTNFLPEELTDEAMVNWYQIANKFGGARLGILDHRMIGYGALEAETTLPWYERKIEMLLEHEVPLEIIGFQCHFGDVLTPPEQVIAILDRFAKFGRELQVAEFDVDTDNEDLQAKYLRDFFIAVYSHPSVGMLQQWGFYEPSHWRPRAALFRTDWSPKPNGQAFLDLVFKKWWTNETGTTDEQGCHRVRAFHGEYEVTVKKGETSRILKLYLGRNAERLHVDL